MGMDHRWGRRQPTDVVVQFVTRLGVTGTGRVLNISLTGAYLETQVPLRLRSVVYLEPAAPASADHRRRIAASVVRQDAPGVGLEWCELMNEKANLYARLAVLLGRDFDENSPPVGRRVNPSGAGNISWHNLV